MFIPELKKNDTVQTDQRVSGFSSTEPKLTEAVSTGLSQNFANVLELDHPALCIITARLKPLAIQLDVDAALLL